MDELVKAIADEFCRVRHSPEAMTWETYELVSAKAALRAIDAAGWQCVPKKATDEMKLAGNEVIGDFTNYEYYGQAEMVCTAMLAAGPKLEKSDG